MNSPKEVAQNYLAIGESKTKLSAGRALVLAILAGMFIGLAGAGATIASATIASPSLAKLIGALVFPVGLAMTLVAGSELFTGNCLIIIPVLERRARLSGMLRNWFFVYIGNLIGGLLVAALAVYGGTFSLFDNAAAASVINTAVAKVSLSFGDALLRGILCNFLVCIAVWMSFAAKDVVGKISGLFLPVMLFVLSGYEHSVANMYYISAGLFAAKSPAYAAAATANLTKLRWDTMFTKNLLPVTIGNIIGGALLVGAAYWFAYIRGGDGAKKPEPKK
ncbi:MAG: formate/nitrite transporter family protein [Oscillospiraceae bacterium]|jgi:formate/nitrite transporter|nr:formate/nitrite transporter family protein [Oscillospiraceae bacterium]